MRGHTPAQLRFRVCVVVVMRWLLFAVALLFPVLTGCAVTRQASYTVSSPGEYTLDTGDIVRVTVYGDTTLTNTYTVTDKGTISFPLAGQVMVRGQTITTAERMITEMLANGYMISPKVSVEVDTYRPFYIEGAVGKAGQYPYAWGMTARAAIAVAGGFAEFADKGRVNVYRRVAGAMTRQSISLDQPILPGDTVVVLERWI